jgi:hypothetical protein
MTVKETTVKRPRCRWNNSAVDIERMRCGGVTKLMSRAFVKKVMERGVPERTGN